MPSLNFNKFPKQVESGEKTQTIRLLWKRPIEVGDRLILFTRLRTKDCRKLGEGVCTEVIPITMRRDTRGTWLILNGKIIHGGDLAAFTLREGFKNHMELFSFFKETYGLPFAGVLIKWEKK